MLIVVGFASVILYWCYSVLLLVVRGQHHNATHTVSNIEVRAHRPLRSCGFPLAAGAVQVSLRVCWTLPIAPVYEAAVCFLLFWRGRE